MLKIIRTGKFEKMLEEACAENVEILPVVKDKIKLFQNNPNDTRLDNHPLTKSLEGKYAFSIDEDIRIVYEWAGKTIVRFLAIGKHTKVYSKKQS